MRRDAALLLATVALGSALSGMGSAQAGVSIVVTGAAGPVAPTDATALQVHRGGGSGHMALIPYYSTQGGNSTLINITNTDEVNGKAVKVRFRGAINADTVYNFTVLLGPADVWSANVSQGADGRSVLTTSDASLTLPANVNGSFLTDRLPTDSAAAQRAEWTREGYVEIITMADIGPSYNCLVITGSPYPRENPLFDAISINAGQEVQSCATNPSIASALNALATAPASELAAYALGLDAPSTGLLVNSMIVNVFDASVAWTTPTTSLTVVNAAGEPARGRIVFSPQTAEEAPSIDLYTNDPLLRTLAGGGVGKIAPKQYDLPDLSTPYVDTAANAGDLPFKHVEKVSAALAVKTLRNEYLLDPSIFAHTDWTLTLPTRRFALGVDYTESTSSNAVVNSGIAGPSAYFPETDLFYYPYTCQGLIAGSSPEFFDRSAQSIGAVQIFSSVVDPDRRLLCRTTTVLTFDGGPTLDSVLRAELAQSIVWLAGLSENALSGFVAGWAVLRSYLPQGMPVIGSAYIGARGPLVSGKSTNFGLVFNHDASR